MSRREARTDRPGHFSAGVMLISPADASVRSRLTLSQTGSARSNRLLSVPMPGASTQSK